MKPIVIVAAISSLVAAIRTPVHVAPGYQLDVLQRQDSVVLRGVVVSSETSNLLPNALVSIPALNLERLANQRGEFVFTGIPNGTYRVRVRQLGYVPFETEVTTNTAAPVFVTMRLKRIAVRLDAMRVEDSWVCTHPGRPTEATGTEAAQVFEQLEQSADRLRIMQKQYPFELWGQRVQYVRTALHDSTQLKIDTVLIDSDNHVKYQVGKMLYSASGGRSKNDFYLRLPTLLDFGGSEFQGAHCFVLRGVDHSHERAELRIDFKASNKIREADVEGSVYLDSASYRLLRAEIRLTRVPREIAGVLALKVTTAYGEITPGLPVISQVHAETSTASPAQRGSTTVAWVRVEDHNPAQLIYRRAMPDSLRR